MPGFWINVDGTPVHVNGRPDMSQETLEALRAVAREVFNLRRTSEGEVMVTCPECKGQRTVFRIACGSRFSRSGPAPCPTCDGTGVVPEERAARIAEGERRRRDRIERGLSVREEAARLGITPSALSRIERGEE